MLKVIYKLEEKNTLLKKKVLELQKELDEIKENFSKVEASKISLKKENEELLKKNEWLMSRPYPRLGEDRRHDTILGLLDLLFEHWWAHFIFKTIRK